jgi:hypothetical protein
MQQDLLFNTLVHTTSFTELVQFALLPDSQARYSENDWIVLILANEVYRD